MRIAKACQECRAGKRRCEETSDALSCRPCLRRDIPCSKNKTATRTPKIAPRLPNSPAGSGISEQSSGTLLELTSEDVDELVGYYLTHIHDRPHSLFHIASLRNLIQDPASNAALICSICALGCRFSPDEQIRKLSKKLAAEAKYHFQATLTDVNIQNIQTCILIANICGAELDSSSEALYFGIATRMAHIMRLNESIPSDSAVQQEVKCRVWCTLFMADRWCSTGLGLPLQIPDLTPNSTLPIDEHVFQSMGCGEMEFPSSQPGLWAHMITLVDIFGPVQDLNRRLVDEDLLEEFLELEVNNLSRRFEVWETQLPQNVRFNPENFDAYEKLGHGSTFIALHLGFHHYKTLLYYHHLDFHRQNPTTQSEIFASRCKHHAMAYSAVLKFSRERGRCSVLHTTAGHMATVSSSVLLHTLLFGDEDEVCQARESLVENFKALVDLRVYWPSLQTAINRLVTFQDACFTSSDIHTHKIDKWVLRFLLEHSMPLDQRTSPSHENLPFIIQQGLELQDGVSLV